MISRILFSIILFAAAVPAAAQSQIGKSISIITEVTGGIGGSSRSLRTGDRVLENERITTDAKGIGQFEFLDATRLAVGPRSSITLDRFVYDRKRTAGKVVLEFGRGAFRFISGRSPSTAYSISTSMATLGVRGTTFDLYVADSGALCVATLSGSVRVCPRGRNCRIHGAIGQYLIVTPDQTFWLLDRWDSALLGGVSFAVAMPFLASQNRLQPAFRASEATVTRYRANAP